VRFCTGTQVSAKYVQVAITSSYTPYFDFSPVGQRQANGTVAINATSAVRYG
jgi:NADPH-dependent curcumin reductase CurA